MAPPWNASTFIDNYLKTTATKRTKTNTRCNDYDIGYQHLYTTKSKAIREALATSWARSSTKQHKVGLRDYTKWCETAAIPYEERFPANEDVLCEYAVSWTGRKGAAGVGAKVNGVRAFHIANGMVWQGGLQLKHVLNGVRRSRPSAKKPPRPPVTYERLEVLIRGLNPASGKDTAVGGMATPAFYGQCRLGELLPESPNAAKFDASQHPVATNLHPPHSVHGSRMLDLPTTKTNSEGERVVICAQLGITNPCTNLDAHLKRNKIQGDVPLASYLDEAGTRRILSKKAFLARCNEIWEAAGLSRLTGHSFRIGGTTYFLLEGIDTDVVKALGRWSSDAFLRYWRSLDILGVMYVERLKEKARKR